MRLPYLMCLAGVAFAIACPNPARASDPAADCEQRKDPQQAIRGCTELIQSGRGNAEQRALVFYLRGLAYVDIHDFDHALADYSQAIDLNSSQSYVYLLDRGVLYRYLKVYTQAKDDFDRIIGLAAN